MTRWICTKDCRALGTNFRKDDIIDNDTNPLPGFFIAYSGDKILPVNKNAQTDMDGTYYYPKPGWDDYNVSATRSILGILSKPDFDYVRMGLLFPQNDTSEKVYIMDHMPHRWMVGSKIHPHVHWLQESEDLPVWKLQYRILNMDAMDPGIFTTITCKSAPLFAYTSGDMRQITEFPEIDMTGLGLSAQFEFILYRDDDVVVGDVLMKNFDFHFRVDSNGSGREYYK